MIHFLGMAAALLLAQEPKDIEVTQDGDWMRATTEHFALSVETADAEVVKKYARQLEDLHGVYAKEFEGAPARTKPLPVKLFKTLREYQIYVKNPNSGGVYDEKKKELATTLEHPRLNETLQHELVHSFEDLMIPTYAASGIATWLSEGMAMYYENCAKDDKGGLTVAVNEERLKTIKQAIKDGKQASFKFFFMWPREQFMAPQVGGQRYAQAWSVYYFLKNTKNEKYKAILPAYLKSLRDGKGWFEAHGAAFKGVDLAQMETEWKDFVSKLEPKK